MKRAVNGDPLRYFESSVTNNTDECILWSFAKDSFGYGLVWLNGRNMPVHRLALLTMIGNPPIDKPYSIHSCKNKNCFNPRHLRWGDQQDNCNDKVKDGTTNRGIKNYTAKLTDDQVLAIYRDKRIQAVIAKEYGVRQTNISSIKSGKSWGWLTNNEGTTKMTILTPEQKEN